MKRIYVYGDKDFLIQLKRALVIEGGFKDGENIFYSERANRVTMWDLDDLYATRLNMKINGIKTCTKFLNNELYKMAFTTEMEDMEEEE